MKDKNKARTGEPWQKTACLFFLKGSVSSLIWNYYRELRTSSCRLPIRRPGLGLRIWRLLHRNLGNIARKTTQPLVRLSY